MNFDLNEVHIIAQDEEFVAYEDDKKKIANEPFVGQCFLSEEEAFIYYQNFARMNRFLVRKGRFVNKNGEMKRRDFFCYREGKADVKLVEYSKQQRNRGSTRCECKAHMHITLRKINEIFPEEWQVTRFVFEHNHVLLSSKEVRFLPSYRSLCKCVGHNVTTCKEKGTSNNHYVATQLALKKKKIATEDDDSNPIFCVKC